ncbi:hypothetical protein M758_UG179500 [Ceratodon purpureus]|nr:hypothetical protein M758_UG179500 [Ceratodon purpureus]
MSPPGYKNARTLICVVLTTLTIDKLLSPSTSSSHYRQALVGTGTIKWAACIQIHGSHLVKLTSRIGAG